MTDIFISYKREDRPLAQRLCHELETRGFTVWWDFALLSGQDYRHIIRHVIDQAGACVVLWSRLSVTSPFVEDEASHALQSGKLCPVLVEDCKIPLGFGQLHTEDMRAWAAGEPSDSIERLAAAISQMISERPHDPESGGSTPITSGELDAFKHAGVERTPRAWKRFIARHPESRFAEFARSELRENRGKFRRRLALATAGTLAVTGISFSVLASVRPDLIPLLDESELAREERTAWRIARGDNTVDSIREFLDEFPAGHFSADAEKRLAGLVDDARWQTVLNNRTVESVKAFRESFCPGAKACTQADELYIELLDTEDWQTALSENSIEAYELYLEKHAPDGIHVAQARQRIEVLQSSRAEDDRRRRSVEAARADESAFRAAQAEGTQEGFEAYLARSAPKAFEREALDAIAELNLLTAWRAATNDGSTSAYQQFLRDHPNSRFAADARSILEQATRDRAEQQAFFEARDTRSVAALSAFLRAWPGSEYTSQATRLIAEIEQAEARSADDAAFRSAASQNTSESYAAYLDAYPLGLHVSEARDGQASALRRDEQIAWNKIAYTNDIYEIDLFLEQYPSGRYSGEARERRADLVGNLERARQEAEERDAWLRVKAENTEDGYRAFLAQYGTGQYGRDARQALDTLLDREIEDAFYRAEATGDVDFVLRFLSIYRPAHPSHEYVFRAERLVSDWSSRRPPDPVRTPDPEPQPRGDIGPEPAPRSTAARESNTLAVRDATPSDPTVSLPTANRNVELVPVQSIEPRTAPPSDVGPRSAVETEPRPVSPPPATPQPVAESAPQPAPAPEPTATSEPRLNHDRDHLDREIEQLQKQPSREDADLLQPH
ncbi:MAG: TIR domain-containing protein [Pseudomonadota bacterium]